MPKNNQKDVIKETGLDKIELNYSINTIEDNIKNRIVGISWKPECPVPLEKLRYLTISYYGFDNKTHIGAIIVHEAVAEDVIDIFKELYYHKFAINKMKLIDEYNANDNLSMEDNNTSGFNYRYIPDTNTISKHGYGLAIDINTVQNPYMLKGMIFPKQGIEYMDRTNMRKGMIIKDDICYKAFIKRGWTWGGDWKGDKDYQHFQKDFDNQ